MEFLRSAPWFFLSLEDRQRGQRALCRICMTCLSNNTREALLNLALQALVNPRSLPVQPEACPSGHAVDGVEAWRQYVREALAAVDEPRIQSAQGGAILRSVRSSQLRCPPSCSTKLRVALLPGSHHIANLNQIEQLVGEYVHAPLAVLSPSTSTATDRTQAGRMGYARSLAAVDVLIAAGTSSSLLAAPLFTHSRAIYVQLLFAAPTRSDDIPCRNGRNWTGGWLFEGGHLPLRRQTQRPRARGRERLRERLSLRWLLGRREADENVPLEVDWATANRQGHCNRAGPSCDSRSTHAAAAASVLVDVYGLRASLEHAIGMRCGCRDARANVSHVCHRQLSGMRRSSRRTMSARDVDATPRSFLCCNASCICQGCHEACTSRFASCPLAGRGRSRGTPPRRPWDTHLGQGGCDER
jgi:hypothetical protein